MQDPGSQCRSLALHAKPWQGIHNNGITYEALTVYTEQFLVHIMAWQCLHSPEQHIKAFLLCLIQSLGVLQHEQ
jgi:hypothetical protein